MPLRRSEMVRATLKGTTLTIQGHAGGAPRGQDLVCAAVSMLAYALAQRLTELERKGALAQPPQIRLTSGDAQIAAIAKENHAAQVQEAFDLIQSGLGLLQHHYPQQVELRTERKEL